MQAKRVVMTDHRQARVQPFEVATEDLGPSEILIRTRLNLISGGTEGSHFLGRVTHGFHRPSYPHYPGYASVGEVIEVGGQAVGHQPGDMVYTTARHASIVRVDTASQVCVKVPDGLPPEEAVFARLMVVPLATLRTTKARAGDRAAVVGLGLVGNLGAQLLQAAGMETTGIEVLHGRRELARRSGIANCVDPREPGAVLPQHRLVLEATGMADGAATALALAELGGEVSLVGTPRRPDPTAPSVSSSEILEQIHLRYITLRSGWEWQLPLHNAGGDPGLVHQPGSISHSTRYALALLRQSKVHVRELATHRYAAEECQQAYEGVVDRKSEVLGTLLCWE